MLGGSKGKDDVNVHIFRNLSPSFSVDNKNLLTRITRNEIEDAIRNAYLTGKMEKVGVNGKGEKGVVDPHALYAGGLQSAGTGGEGGGREKRGKSRGGTQRHYHQQQYQQYQQQQQRQPN